MPTTAESTPPSTSTGRAPGAVRIRSSHACIGPTRLHDRVAGDGPPLVLVHGYGAASSWWHHNMGPLAEQRRIYAPDLGGFGRSRPKHPFSLERTVACLASWMQQLGLPYAGVCGHSLGGHICLRLAAPTLLVWGERDVLVPLELGQMLHRALQGVRLVIVPDAGHNVMCERPEQFNRLVLDFLAE